jgi:broad specificity polyphosphatase/5'/3'-nucleotidase SurE
LKNPANTGISVVGSGTVGAALEALALGIPAIAFSGDSGSKTAWNETTPEYALVYAALSTTITQTLLASGAPFLPTGVWLNVNFPEWTNTACSTADEYEFVLSRIWTAIPLISAADVETCGAARLPTETTVHGAAGCYVSISPGYANRLDANTTDQAIVLSKLESILSCLP